MPTTLECRIRSWNTCPLDGRTNPSQNFGKGRRAVFIYRRLYFLQRKICRSSIPESRWALVEFYTWSVQWRFVLHSSKLVMKSLFQIPISNHSSINLESVNSNLHFNLVTFCPFHAMKELLDLSYLCCSYRGLLYMYSLNKSIYYIVFLYYHYQNQVFRILVDNIQLMTVHWNSIRFIPLKCLLILKKREMPREKMEENPMLQMEPVHPRPKIPRVVAMNSLLKVIYSGVPTLLSKANSLHCKLLPVTSTIFTQS